MFLSETSFMQDTASHNRDRVTISNLDHFARCKGSVPNEGRMIGEYVFEGATVEQ